LLWEKLQVFESKKVVLFCAKKDEVCERLTN